MPGTLGHLGSRFFEVLFASPLSDTERAMVETWLTAGLGRAFFDQSAADQRHGYEAGKVVLETGGGPDAIVAALMHDTGKRHAELGVLGRVAASVLIKLNLPLPRRMRLYRDHGITAATELAGMGAPPLAIDFALHHHGDRPASIPPQTWELLVRADQPKATKLGRSRISSSVT